MCISGRSGVDCVIPPWKLMTHFKVVDQLLQQKHANVGQLDNSLLDRGQTILSQSI